MAYLAQHAPELGLVHVSSLGSTTVALPPLVSGAPFGQRWPLNQEPRGTAWSDTRYETYAPWVFVIPNALVHSRSGIVCVGGYVIEETLVHTHPQQQVYVPERDGIWIDVAAAAPMRGAHVSVLCGSAESYAHAMLDGFGRLAAVPHNILAAAAGLLTAGDGFPPVAWLRQHVCDRWSLRQTAMPEHGNVGVEQLVLALASDTSCNHHPCLVDWFADMGAFAQGEQATSARRIFVGRGEAAGRTLLDEEAVTAALAPLGVQSAAPEYLSAPAQIALFQNAELVVAPHGAGLTNLVFAQPGCRVIELQMDGYCHWGFRRLAGLKGLRYDCVMGRMEGRWPGPGAAIHAARWQISVPHVVAAVNAALGR